MSVDAAQKQAIEHHKGPMLVLAGPGSGKTLVITRRTRWLIQQAGVAPGNILVVTFTRAAAGKMRSRFDRLMDGRHLPVSFGTFHAIFFTILKYAYKYKVENILSEDEKYGILRDIMHQIDVEMDDEKDFVMDIAGEISRVKGDMIPLEHFYPVKDGKLKKKATDKNIDGDDSYKVVITSESIDVAVSGKVAYVSGNNVKIKDEKTVSIQKENADDTSLTYIVYK